MKTKNKVGRPPLAPHLKKTQKSLYFDAASWERLNFIAGREGLTTSQFITKHLFL